MALSKLEPRILTDWWDDGLVDLFGGAGILLIGVAWQLDIVTLGAIAPALLVPLWAPIRARFIVPRAGFVAFGAPTRARMTRGYWLVLAAGFSTFVLAVALFFLVRDGARDTGRTFVAGLPAGLLGMGGLLCWIVFRIPRLPLYSAVLVAAGGLTVLAGASPAPAMLASGGIVTAGGAVLLTRFLRAHPLPVESQ